MYKTSESKLSSRWAWGKSTCTPSAITNCLNSYFEKGNRILSETEGGLYQSLHPHCPRGCSWMSTTAVPGSVATLHRPSSEPGGKVEAFLQVHPATWKGWAGKAGSLHPCTELVPAPPWGHPTLQLCPPAQRLETPCPETWGWKALKIAFCSFIWVS